jgi:hypothetical protein
MAEELNLENIKNKIEKMNTENQLKILDIFVKNGVNTNQNKTGTRLNLGYLYQNNPDIFKKMMECVQYIENQEKNLNEIETEKEQLSNLYFSKKENIES